MKIAVLGTGEVGRRLAGAFAGLGHQVTLGSRSAANPAAVSWAEATGGSCGTYADAATAAELVVNATAGMASLAALTSAGAENLAHKTIVDVSNPLDFSGGGPLPVARTFRDGISLAEEIQLSFPDSQVVKTLNTMSNTVMVDPGRVPRPHHVFLSGDHPEAKSTTATLLRQLGWTDDQILDLGPLATARPTEQHVVLWVALYQALGTGDVNIAVQRAPETG